MSQERPPLFGRTPFLVGQIMNLLDKLAGGAMLFEHGLKNLLEHSVNESTREKADSATGPQGTAARNCVAACPTPW